MNDSFTPAKRQGEGRALFQVMLFGALRSGRVFKAIAPSTAYVNACVYVLYRTLYACNDMTLPAVIA